MQAHRYTRRPSLRPILVDLGLHTRRPRHIRPHLFVTYDGVTRTYNYYYYYYYMRHIYRTGTYNVKVYTHVRI